MVLPDSRFAATSPLAIRSRHEGRIGAARLIRTSQSTIDAPTTAVIKRR
jgi:hypothetical protein